MKYLILLVLLFAAVAHGKPITSTINFSHDCQTVDGESLDPNGDGVCELLTGFRAYTAEGEFITGIPEDGTRTISVDYNAPVWTRQCFKMTAVIDDLVFNPGAVFESDFSNVGGCVDVVPGKPNPPQIQ